MEVRSWGVGVAEMANSLGTGSSGGSSCSRSSVGTLVETWLGVGVTVVAGMNVVLEEWGGTL
jgi:hypothetical protein